MGTTIGVVKGDTRSLDSSSNEVAKVKKPHSVLYVPILVA